MSLMPILLGAATVAVAVYAFFIAPVGKNGETLEEIAQDEDEAEALDTGEEADEEPLNPPSRRPSQGK